MEGSQAYSSEVYSWSPVYRNRERGSTEPCDDPSSNRQAVLYHSGLKQQVEIYRQIELQEEITRKETSPRQVEESRLDPKVTRKVANSDLRNCFARAGDLIFIIILVALIVFIFFLGIFFTYYHTR